MQRRARCGRATSGAPGPGAPAPAHLVPLYLPRPSPSAKLLGLPLLKCSTGAPGAIAFTWNDLASPNPQVDGQTSGGATPPARARRSMSAVAVAVPSIVSGRYVGQHAAAGRVVLYDGLCNLCNWGVRWVAARDPDKRIMFCSVQSFAAEPYLRGMGLTRQQVLQRFVFVEYANWSAGSTAALRVCRYLKQPWPLAQYLLLVPLPVRDGVYDAIAASRYRLFGRTPCCQVPDAALLDRFVDRDELVAGLCSTEAMEVDPEEEQQGPGGPDQGAGTTVGDSDSTTKRRQQDEGSSTGSTGSGSGGSGKGGTDRHQIAALRARGWRREVLLGEGGTGGAGGMSGVTVGWPAAWEGSGSHAQQQQQQQQQQQEQEQQQLRAFLGGLMRDGPPSDLSRLQWRERVLLAGSAERRTALVGAAGR